MRLFISGSAPLLEETHRAWFERDRACHSRTLRDDRNQHDRPPTPMMASAGPEPLACHCRASRCASRIRKPARFWAKGKPASSRSRGQMSSRATGAILKRPRGISRATAIFITGDLGKIDQNGYVHILGRAKDVIISGGFNVYPKEVEAEIDALSGVTESAVIGLPHEDFGEAVAAIVVPAPGAVARRAIGARRARQKARQIQIAEARDLRRRPAAQCDGQGAEESFARDF